ncbi:MAG: hypothetical protein JW941_00320, partial [Candidatus Coatesbacteria bacterium]|nr:hypothetical protein [Candidatus Coatesbacteria bacterium]
DPIEGDSGEFLFAPEDVEGVYEFYTLSTDNIGNIETEVAPLSMRASTIYDRSVPSSAATSTEIVTAAPFDVEYTAIDNGPAGLDKIALWYKLNSGVWKEYMGGFGTAPLGAISFDPPDGLEGSYGFFTIAIDKAGNEEPRPGQAGEPPVVDTTTIYDTTPPESAALVAEYSKAAPIHVSFTATDGASGIANVALFAKFGEAGLWGPTGLSSTNASGTFNYQPTAGEGTYFFYTVATDKAGFVEPTPLEADDQTLYDITAPTTVLSGPTGVSSLPIPLDYACVDPEDLSGSPIANVLLFYRFNLGSSWMNTGLSAHAENGTFNFSPTEGPGIYEFYSIGIDMAGNRESALGKTLTKVAYDISSPISVCSCDNTSRQLPLLIDYRADGTGSDILSIDLFYNYEGMGWLPTGITLSGEMGTFLFNPAEADGIYQFYTSATDSAGNVETWTGAPDCSTFLDTVAPVTEATAPAWTTASPVVIDFEASDEGIGIAVVELWAKYDVFSWQKVDEKAAVGGGQFIYDTDLTGGVFSFYTIGRDLAGNVEAAPEVADATTAFDQAAPISKATVPPYTTDTSIDVGYTAVDLYSGLDHISLWCRYSRGSWFDTGYVAYGTHGTIAVTLTRGAGKYDFYTKAFDNAGNVESSPSVPDGSCYYDLTRPTSSCSCIDYTTDLPLNVRYSAADDETGIDSVSLWYSFDEGDWKESGLTNFNAWGTFEFSAPDGEGKYEFYTIAVNKAGWQELAPVTPDADSYYDITLPSSSVSSPEIATGDMIPVSFSAWDAMSGVKHVTLWYRFDDRLWAKSGYQEETTAGTIDFVPPDGVGTYAFWTTATDNCGNTEPAPTTSATVSAVTVFDNVPAVSRASVDVDYTNESPIEVGFTASDAGTGVASVQLWYNVGGGAYKDTGLSVTGSTIGVFEFVPIEGDGLYGFYSLAEDMFGNREAVPYTADATAVFDTTPPFSRAESSAEANATEFTVTFTATDILSPIESVSLWYRYAANLSGGWTEWTDAGMSLGGEAGMLPFVATHGEGYYEFYTIAVDAAGNSEQPPTSADSRTQYRILYPELELSQTSHDFGDVEVGASAFWPSLYAENIGEAVLTIESITIDNSAFQCSVLTPLTVEPDTRVFLPVMFTPSHSGLFEGIITIVTNDPMQPEVQVELSGTGVIAALKMSLDLDSNGRIFYPGDTLTVSLSCYNHDDTLYGMDLYISVILPSGNVIYLPELGSEETPYVSNFDVLSGFRVDGLEILSVTIPNGFAPGHYMWRAYLVPNGQAKELLASSPMATTIDHRPLIDLTLEGTYPIYGKGQKQVLTARFKNDGLEKTMDLYLALQAPDGTLLFGPELTTEFVPYFDNYDLPMFADVWPVMLYSNKLDLLPAGKYTWLAAFSDADSFNLISSIAQVEWELE